MACIDILSDDDVSRIHEAVLDVLERVGMMFQSEAVLSALDKIGAKVDRSTESARIPRNFIEGILDEERKKSVDAPSGTTARITPPGKRGIGLQVAQFYHDHRTNERRSGNREDFIRMLHFGEAFEEDLSVGHCLLMTDVDQRIEPLEALRLLLEHTSRPGNVYPYYADQFDYLGEIGEIYAGNKERFITGGIFLTSPLRICRRAADFMVKRLSMGLSCGTGSMPVGGASTPVTIAGTIVVGAAEMLGAWAAVKALKPDAPLTGGVGAGAVDMQTGNVSFCSPDAMMYNFGIIEFFRKVCGKTINLAGASDYCDAKVPGVKAAMEKALKAMTVAAFLGRHPGVGGGMVESGKTLSAVQILLDGEYNNMVRLMAAPPVVNEDTIGLDTIESVGLGIGKNYIDTEHTFAHFRNSLWLPRFLDRTAFESYEKEAELEAQVVKKAADRVEDVIASYKKPEVDEDMLKRVDAVLERARKNLCR